MTFLQGKSQMTKKRLGGTVLIVLLALLIVGYLVMYSPMSERSQYQILYQNFPDPLHWLNPENVSEIQLRSSSTSNISDLRNFSSEGLQWLYTWEHLKQLDNISDGLPHAAEAVNEARLAWDNLTISVQNRSSRETEKKRQCPFSIRKMNVSNSDGGVFTVDIPCGLVTGSSVTLIGTPGSISGDFKIDLLGKALPSDLECPTVLHYNVRLSGDKLTQDPVIVQNTFTASSGWGREERCPCSNTDNATKVDDLEQCNALVGKDDKKISSSRRHLNAKKYGNMRRYFPFKQGYLAIATLRIGTDGIQMTVDGKHITSFAHRPGLEPWFVTKVRVSGDIQLATVIVSGLPTAEDLENTIDLEMLKSPPIPTHKDVDLLIGIFSTANNFKRRMAIRRTWMQYNTVRQGIVIVRFFVGLMVNEELWNEARTYGDIQLLLFVDYYSLITWKTLAICIYGTNDVSARFLMKTDDDAFVRVDEILSSVKQLNVSHGLLYGRINYVSGPHRNRESKWYISPEEWPDEKYPPWAHGPGYVVSQDIAKAVYDQYKARHLKMFKLEDVGMGIWVDEMRKDGLDVKYETDERIHTDDCKDGYIVAHYQEPRQMLCLWEKLLETNQAKCCSA